MVAPVHLRVGRVLELLRHDVARVLAAQLLRREHGARHPLDGRREDELGAEAARAGGARSRLMSSGIVRMSR